nr:protein IQ-DOMAIN 1 isoform X2 [Ipomoea batatas]
MFPAKEDAGNFDNVLGISPSRRLLETSKSESYGSERDCTGEIWRRGLPGPTELTRKDSPGTHRKICYPECKDCGGVQDASRPFRVLPAASHRRPHLCLSQVAPPATADRTSVALSVSSRNASHRQSRRQPPATAPQPSATADRTSVSRKSHRQPPPTAPLSLASRTASHRRPHLCLCQVATASHRQSRRQPPATAPHCLSRTQSATASKPPSTRTRVAYYSLLVVNISHLQNCSISLFTVARSQSVEARRALRLERIGEASSYSLRMAARPWETRLLEQATSNSSKPCTAKVRKNNVTKRISTKPPEAVPKFL